MFAAGLKPTLREHKDSRASLKKLAASLAFRDAVDVSDWMYMRLRARDFMKDAIPQVLQVAVEKVRLPLLTAAY